LETDQFTAQYVAFYSLLLIDRHRDDAHYHVFLFGQAGMIDFPAPVPPVNF
jgi:hypothetical protein